MRSQSVTITQTQPVNIMDAKIKLTLPIGADIRLNDKIVDCKTGLEYTAEQPVDVRGHHLFAYQEDWGGEDVMSRLDIDMTEYKEFFGKMEQFAKGQFKEELIEYVDTIGFDFLRVVQDEIVRRKVIDTRLLLASFEKGSAGNIWEIADGGLTLEVGTNVEYATYVHDGHWTNSKGVAQRWVPGYWEGDRFIYDPAAKTGMLLKQKWVKGNPYFDSAIRIYNKIFQASLEVKLEEWLDKYLGG